MYSKSQLQLYHILIIMQDPSQLENTQLQPKTQNQKPVPDNYLTYHRWLIGMECRKDILLENEIINKRIFERVTPFRTRFTTKITNNKMRFVYFFGFCILFNLQPVYNYLILDNPYLHRATRALQSQFSKPPKTLQHQHQISEKLSSLQIDSTKKAELCELFKKVDRAVVVDRNFMQEIGGNKQYGLDYVDIATFVEFLGEIDVRQTKERISMAKPGVFGQL